MEVNEHSAKLDGFDRAIHSVRGLPGYSEKVSVIEQGSDFFFTSSKWIITSVRTDDQQAVFLEWIGQAGGDRLVIPPAVVKVIYRHHNQFRTIGRKLRGQRAADTRKRKQVAIEEDSQPETND